MDIKKTNPPGRSYFVSFGKKTVYNNVAVNDKFNVEKNDKIMEVDEKNPFAKETEI